MAKGIALISLAATIVLLAAGIVLPEADGTQTRFATENCPGAAILVTTTIHRHYFAAQPGNDVAYGLAYLPAGERARTLAAVAVVGEGEAAASEAAAPLDLALDPALFSAAEIEAIAECLTRNRDALNRALERLGAHFPAAERRRYRPPRLGDIAVLAPPATAARAQPAVSR